MVNPSVFLLRGYNMKGGRDLDPLQLLNLNGVAVINVLATGFNLW
jgi:hypothetical protein